MVLLLLVSACDKQNPLPAAPRANLLPVQLQIAGETWTDPYVYLSDPALPETRAYLEAETEFFASTTQGWQAEIERISAELNRDLPTERFRPPIRSGHYLLTSEISRGKQYPTFSRTHLETGRTDVILDANVRAADNDYYDLGGFAMQGDLLAITEDRSADGLYDLYVIDLTNGEAVRLARKVNASLGWHAGKVVFVSGNKVMMARHSGDQSVLYEEADPAFGLSVHSDGDKALLIRSESHDATELRRIDASGQMSLIAARQNGHRYRVKTYGNRMMVVSNLNQADFGLALAEMGDDIAQWQFVDLQDGYRIHDFEPSDRGVFLHGKDGLKHHISFLSFVDRSVASLLSADAGEQLSFHTLDESGGLRFWRRGLLTPDTYWRVSPGQPPELLREQQPSGDYDAGLHRLEQFTVTARDETEVPVTLLYREGKPLTDRPMIIQAYGAYGLEQDLRFDPSRLPLLRRGFILAWAHVRGGGELGAMWHRAGRGLNKRHSFHDYQDVALRLPELGYGAPERLAGRFSSAGGAIGGFVINDSPDLLKVVTLRSPFVDIVTTLLDESQPLTVSDRLEWGDPRESRQLRYQLGYSPYQKVARQIETDVLILAGRNDRLVRVHEPLKWLAKLRTANAGDALLLIDIQQNSGHLGATDQHARRRQTALELAFIFTRLGVRI